MSKLDVSGIKNFAEMSSLQLCPMEIEKIIIDRLMSIFLNESKNFNFYKKISLDRC